MTTTYTQYYGFEQPSFDTVGWHTAVNGNFARIDALLKLSTVIASAGAVWANSTAYAVSDVILDQADYKYYRCLVAHTSASSGSFATDRTSNPTYWELVDTGLSLRGEWVTGRVYYPGDVVSDGDEGILAICATQHTSTTDIRTDVANWDFVFDAQVALDAKADVTYVDTELSTKADTTYVDNEVSDLTTVVSGKLATASNLSDVASKPTTIANLRYAPRAVTSASSSGDRTFAATDIGRVIIVNGTGAAAVALTLPDPATLPDGWSAFVKVPGDVIATITPSSGTVDGAASLKMRFNQECMIYKDGSVYRTHGMQRRVRLALQKLTVAAAEVIFTLPLSWRSFEIDWEARHASGASSPWTAQFSSDGGATYVNGASDYTYSFALVSGSAATNSTSNGNSGVLGFVSQNFAGPEKVSFTLTDQSPKTETLHVRGRNHYWLGSAYGFVAWTANSSAVSLQSNAMKLINPIADFTVGSYFDLYGVNEA